MKRIMIAFTLVLIMVLVSASYFLIWGGKPQIENFDAVSKEYEQVAEITLSYYKELSPAEQYITINVHETSLDYGDEPLNLTDSQITAVKAVYEKFDYIRVCKDAVFFHEDETGYYGLVYSKNPLSALYKNELPQAGREYHRINSRWYEWGVFGR